MRRLRCLLKKEFLQIKRNRFLARLILIMPIVQLVVLPWAATFEQHNISIGVVDSDRSSYSRRLIDEISASSYFILEDFTANYKEGLASMELGNSDIILEIPKYFERELINNRPIKVLATINAVNGQKAGIGGNYLMQIISKFGGDLVSNRGEELPQGLTLQSRYRYNEDMSYHTFMVPGILVILVTLIGGMLSAMNIVREKEMGTMEQINVTPIPKYLFILAKLIPFWIIGLLLLTIGMGVIWVIYGLTPLGSLWSIYLYSFIYLIAFTGFGLMISNFAQTQQQAMFIIFFFFLIFILLSGLFTPISSMPNWAQNFTLINPLRYYVEVMRAIYIRGSELANLSKQFMVTTLFVILFNLLAVLTYKKVK